MARPRDGSRRAWRGRSITRVLLGRGAGGAVLGEASVWLCGVIVCVLHDVVVGLGFRCSEIGQFFSFSHMVQWLGYHVLTVDARVRFPVWEVVFAPHPPHTPHTPRTRPSPLCERCSCVGWRLYAAVLAGGRATTLPADRCREPAGDRVVPRRGRSGGGARTASPGPPWWCPGTQTPTSSRHVTTARAGVRARDAPG